MTRMIDEAIATYRAATTAAAVQKEVRSIKKAGLPSSAKDVRAGALEFLVMDLQGARA